MIINLKRSLTQFLSPQNIICQAKNTGFVQRLRDISPFRLVCCFIAAMSQSHCSSIAALHRQYNGMQLSLADFVAYKPFHNQLRKPAFVYFMETLTRQAIARFLSERIAIVPEKLQQFKQVILHDGTSFAVHKGLSDDFPSRFHHRFPAAVECHLSLSLFDRQPLAMAVSADTAPEQHYHPSPETLRGKLLLADAGYLNLRYFSSITENGGYFLVRGKNNLNPAVSGAWNGQGKPLRHLSGLKLKDLSRRKCRTEVTDIDAKWAHFSCRIIRRWFAEEKRFCCWVTNLSREEFSADEVMSLYRCRWQIELFFKELKSSTNLKGFVTKQKAIAEGLIWASLLTAMVRRHTATWCQPDISFQKMAGNVDVWFLPVIQSLAHRALSELEHRLEWAVQYLADNARPARQKKRCQNKSLRDIFEMFNA
jgi:hypothetical protein